MCFRARRPWNPDRLDPGRRSSPSRYGKFPSCFKAGMPERREAFVPFLEYARVRPTSDAARSGCASCRPGSERPPDTGPPAPAGAHLEFRLRPHPFRGIGPLVPRDPPDDRPICGHLTATELYWYTILYSAVIRPTNCIWSDAPLYPLRSRPEVNQESRQRSASTMSANGIDPTMTTVSFRKCEERSPNPFGPQYGWLDIVAWRACIPVVPPRRGPWPRGLSLRRNARPTAPGDRPGPGRRREA